MKTSGENTETDRPNHENRDLQAFEPSPPEHRLDDKAASLEDDVQSLKAEFKRERFVYIFSVIVLFLLFVGSVGNESVFVLAIIAALILLIGLANWLQFPWVVVNLQRWHDLCFLWMQKKVRGETAEDEDTEPLPK